MLKKFSVTNFKNFQEKVTFDLGKTNNYQFNTECISNKIVNKAIIYGKNASGKTNLILGITDIIGNITDYGAQPKNNFYTNLLNDVERSAVFEYELCINDKSIIYRYEKKDQNTLVSEVLYFNNEVIVQRNSSQSHFTINIPGLENFDNTLEDVNLSVIKYIYKNTKIKDLDNDTAKLFVLFINFVEKMLMFYSLKGNGFIGYRSNKPENILKKIVEFGKIKKFESFLKDFDLNYELIEIKNDRGEPSIAIKYEERYVDFNQIVSSGTSALGLFYYWYINIIDDVSLVIIDEFDAFYHNKLSTKLVKLLIDLKCQVILTTHNTSIMTNELMRPDCYFRINSKGISSLANATAIEIREAHNLEKIYKSGWFDD